MDDRQNLNPYVIDPDFSYTDIENFYDRVGSCLGIGPGVISKEVIDYPENAPLAEARVKKLIPNWQELDKTKFSLFESCIIFMTCYILCPIANRSRVSKQTTPSLTLQFSDSAIQAAPCDHYLELMNDLAEEIIEEETDAFFGFRVTQSSECKRRVVWPSRMPH